MTKLALAALASYALESIGGGCKKKAGDGGAASSVAKMRELKDKMCACKDPDCAKKVSDEMTKWSQEQGSKQAAQVKMNEADQKAAAELGIAMGECMQKASKVEAAPTPPPAADGSGSGSAAAAGSGSATPSGLPKECDEYEAAINRLATCDKMSKQARETLVKAYAEAAEGWKKLPEAAKEKISVSCKSGAEAVISSAKTQCGW
jgi:hypothetical protein